MLSIFHITFLGSDYVSHEFQIYCWYRNSLCNCFLSWANVASTWGYFIPLTIFYGYDVCFYWWM